MKNVLFIGYSGHSFVVAESALNSDFVLKGYFESDEKELNPFNIPFFGIESKFDFTKFTPADNLFVAVGNNSLRKKLFDSISAKVNWCNIVDPSAIVTTHIVLGQGIYIGKRAVVNPLCKIGNGVIINTGAIVEHECVIGEFTHIAPGSVLCGNVTIGVNSFIGANCVIKQGIKIGSDVVIGAGSVVIKDIPDACVFAGNPAIKIK